MNEDNVIQFRMPGMLDDGLTELLRNGAKQLIQQALPAPLGELLEKHDDLALRQSLSARSSPGWGRWRFEYRRCAAAISDPVVFHSSLVPPYVRRSKSVDAALPWLYLKEGISSGDMQDALEVLVGPDASGLSAILRKCSSNSPA